MRSFRHWTSRYVLDRIIQVVYERLHPDWPWLNKPAVEMLVGWLQPEYRGLEWGSGRSTLWLARKVSFLVSIEHDRSWYTRISRQLKEQGFSNVDYRFCEKESDYVSVADQLPQESLDFVLVDGIARGQCALAAVPKLKTGGLLILDNSNWFLPSASRSPNSRRLSQGSASEVWNVFLSELKRWRCTWTTDGVTDTACWEKPKSNEQTFTD